jgi:hypothetical protein
MKAIIPLMLVFRNYPSSLIFDNKTVLRYYSFHYECVHEDILALSIANTYFLFSINDNAGTQLADRNQAEALRNYIDNISSMNHGYKIGFFS